MYSRLAILLISAIASLLAGCEPMENNNPTVVDSAPEPARLVAEDATAQLWQKGNDALSKCVNHSNTLTNQIQTFLANPTLEHLHATQQEWKDTARIYHGFYFFSQLRIIEPQVFAPLSKYWFAISAQPIQPGYLDYFGPYPYAGLVHDIGIPINTETLRHQHGMTDVEDVVLGLYAIEFMLFGENGTRPESDYAPVTTLSLALQQAGYKTPEETPNNRRRELLALQARRLEKDTQHLQQAWNATDANSMRQHWDELPPSAKHMAAMKTVERTLTQLLLLTASTSPTTDEATQSSPAAARQAAIIAEAIHSLQSATPWLATAQQSAVTQHLQQAADTLSGLASNSGDQPLAEQWRAVYQALKKAMDVFTGSA